MRPYRTGQVQEQQIEQVIKLGPQRLRFARHDAQGGLWMGLNVLLPRGGETRLNHLHHAHLLFRGFEEKDPGVRQARIAL